MKTFPIESKFMARCLQLAENARQDAKPNPLVGAVIVYDTKIIGEGYHTAWGEPHAEVNAIASVKDAALLKDSTMYVSLEPCSHYGKTPPCAELIIKTGIPRVVIGMSDPFPEVSGRGIAMLQKAGINVHTGLLEDECRKVNERFITFHTQKRPYIILKWAQSSDGYIDAVRGEDNLNAAIISNDVTQLYVHKLRSTVGAIMVGTNTALMDNPSLTTRLWKGKNPIRLVIDRTLRVPGKSKLFDGQQKTIVFTEKNKLSENENIQYEYIDFSIHVIPQIMSHLYKIGIQSVLVEGGRQFLQSFIDQGFWDEAYCEIADGKIRNGVPAPLLKSDMMEIQKIRSSTCIKYKNTQSFSFS